jgi:sortase A
VRRWWPVAALALAGAAVFGHGAYILVKAEVAQVLLGRAWARTQGGEAEVRPWSWADTWPVARLEAPRQGADMIVLEGASGAVLAFGPGHLAGSAAPGEPGNVVIAGHRDTHFELLRDLEVGNELWLESAAGVRRHYRVDSARVVEDDDVSVLEPTGEDVLTLVTCYPFDTVVPGGPLRYVVRAVAA